MEINCSDRFIAMMRRDPDWINGVPMRAQSLSRVMGIEVLSGVSEEFYITHRNGAIYCYGIIFPSIADEFGTRSIFVYPSRSEAVDEGDLFEIETFIKTSNRDTLIVMFKDNILAKLESTDG